jgi:ABC-2 type transport system ATP-binding protein
MVHEPPILILDEPTVGLDPIQIRETLALIRELGERRTILLSTHILSEVEAICRRVIIIAAGRVGLDRKMAELESAKGDIVMEVAGPTDPVANVLRTTDGVVHVTTRSQANGVCSFEVRTRDNLDLREALSQRIVKNGWSIRQLSLRRRKLEDHFFEVVAAADPLKTGRRPEGPDRYQAD